MKKIKIAGSVLLIAGLLMSSCSTEKDSKDKKKEKTPEVEVETEAAEETTESSAKETEEPEETDEPEETEATEAEETETEPTEPEKEEAKPTLVDDLITAASGLNAKPYLIYGDDDLTPELSAKGVMMSGNNQAFKDLSKRIYTGDAVENEKVRLGDIAPDLTDDVERFSCYYKCSDRGDDNYRDEVDKFNSLRVVAVEFDSAKTAKDEFMSHLKEGAAYTGSVDVQGDQGEFILKMNKAEYIDYCVAQAEKEYASRGSKFDHSKKLREYIEEEITDEFVCVTGQIYDGRSIISIDLKSMTGDVSSLDQILAGLGRGKASEASFDENLRDDLIDRTVASGVLYDKKNDLPDYKFNPTTFRKNAVATIGFDQDDFIDYGEDGRMYIGEQNEYRVGYTEMRRSDYSLMMYFYHNEIIQCLTLAGLEDFQGTFEAYPYMVFIDGKVKTGDKEKYLYGGSYLSGKYLVFCYTNVDSDETRKQIDTILSDNNLPDVQSMDPSTQMKFELPETSKNPAVDEETFKETVASLAGVTDEDWRSKDLNKVNTQSVQLNLNNNTEDKLNISIMTYGSEEEAAADLRANAYFYMVSDLEGAMIGENKFGTTEVLLNGASLTRDVYGYSNGKGYNAFSDLYGGRYLVGNQIFAVITTSKQSRDTERVDNILKKLGLDLPKECDSAISELENIPETTSTAADYSDCHFAFWVDANYSLGRDAQDTYYIDDKVVSMKDWYEAKEQVEDLKMTADAFLMNPYSSAYSSISTDAFASKEEFPENPFITWTTVDQTVPGEDTVCTINVPLINFDTEDAKAANAVTMDKISRFDYPDESVKILLYAANGYNVCLYSYNSNFWSFTFDSEGRRISNEEIIASAGWENEEFWNTALTQVHQMYLNQTECAFYGDDFFVDYGTLTSSLAAPEMFINMNGDVVLILKYFIDSTPIRFDFCVPVERPGRELGTEIPEVKDPINLLDKQKSFYESLRTRVPDFETTEPISKSEIDVNKDIDNLVYKFINHGANADDASGAFADRLRIYMPERLNAEDVVKAEVYKDGELVAELQGEITVAGGRECAFDITNYKHGSYCILVFAANDSDMVVEEIHYKLK